MNRFTLRQLSYFCAIATTGSISAAAASELVSRSAMASALDELEKALATKLCIREKANGVELTAAGQHVFDLAVSLLAQADELESTAGDQVLKGGLSIGCFISLAPTIFPTMMGLFAAHHSGVDLQIFAGSQDVLMQRLRTGEIELAITYNTDGDRAYETAPLYETRMHAIFTPEHPLARQETISPSELADEPLIILDIPPSPEYVLAYFAAHGIAPRIRHRTNHFELVRSLVARGLGYSLCIQEPRNRASYEGLPIVSRALSPAPKVERVAITWAAGRVLSSKAKEFIRLAQANVESLRPG